MTLLVEEDIHLINTNVTRINKGRDYIKPRNEILLEIKSTIIIFLHKLKWVYYVRKNIVKSFMINFLISSPKYTFQLLITKLIVEISDKIKYNIIKF